MVAVGWKQFQLRGAAAGLGTRIAFSFLRGSETS